MATYEITLDTNAEDEWDYEDAEGEMKFAFERLGADNLFIQAEGMGWTRASAYIVVPVSRAVDALKLNGEYRVVLTVNDEDATDLRAVRYSHDEPTGASFTFRPATDEEVEDSRY